MIDNRWRVRIECWPHSGVDQKLAGRKVHDFEVEADDIFSAAEKAKLYQAGMERSPQVWQAPITSIRKMAHDEHVPYQDKHLNG